ncbi:MAG: hypothetical protein ABFQ82_00850 [Thermodesulfobacteriota bacterium]
MKIIDLNKEPAYWPGFYGLPEKIYGADPLYVKSSADSVRCCLEDTGSALAMLPLIVLGGDNKVAARLVVSIPRQPPAGEQERPGVFGFFEACRDFEPVKAMFDHGREWLWGKGIRKVVGPMDGDTWHKYRFNIGPFERSPFLMEPYNPHYYPELWERYGFRPLAGYYSKYIPELGKVLPSQERFFRRCLKNGFRFRSFRKRDYDSELDILYDLSRAIFAENFYYTDISRQGFKELYNGAAAIIKEELIWFASDKEGEYCGFVFALPDYYEAVRSLRGKKDLWSKIKFLYNRQKTDTLNVKTLGVLKKYHGSGLGPALIYKAYLEGYKLGFSDANMCLIHETNPSGRLDGGEGEVSRRYMLYEKYIQEAELSSAGK